MYPVIQGGNDQALPLSCHCTTNAYAYSSQEHLLMTLNNARLSLSYPNHIKKGEKNHKKPLIKCLASHTFFGEAKKVQK